MTSSRTLVALSLLLSGCTDSVASSGDTGRAPGFGGTSGGDASGAAGFMAAGTAGASGSGVTSIGGGQGGGGEAGTAGSPGSSSGGAAGAGGASGGTSGAAGGGSTNCPGGAVFCEDFETGSLDGWVKKESGGTLAIDGTHASSGQSALAITMATGQRGGWLDRVGAPLFPLAANAIYGRVMVYFESLPAGHTDFIRGAATNGQTPWYNVGEQTGKVLLNYFSGGSDCWARPSPSTNIPLETWMCWEWVYDGTKDQMQLFIDEQLMRTVDGVGDGCSGPNVWNAPDFNYLAIGAYNAQPNNSPSVGKMWFDDVAVGTTARLGCPSNAAE